MIPILYHLFQKIEVYGTYSMSFNEASITIIPKLNKDIISKENYRPESLINIDAKSLKIFANQI